MGSELELADASEDVFEAMAAGEAVEPVAAGEVGHRNVAVAEELDGLGAELDVAKEGDVVEVSDTDFFEEFVAVADLEDFGGAPDVEAGGVEVEGAFFSDGGNEAAEGFGLGGLGGRRFGAAEEVGFVGQADRGEGAAGAFGGVNQGWRDGAGGTGAGLVEGAEGPGFEFGGEVKGNALFGPAIVDQAGGTGVAVVAEKEDLEGELDFVRVPKGGKIVDEARGAGFVINRAGVAGGTGFDKVEFCRDAESVGAELHGARVDGFGLVRGIEGWVFGSGWFGGFGEVWGREVTFSGIDFLMEGGSALGVGVGKEEALDVFVVEEAGTIDELVDHAGGQDGGRVGKWCDGGRGRLLAKGFKDLLGNGGERNLGLVG